MLISSSNKTINTYPLLNLLREGENNNGDKITFEGGKYKCIAPDGVVCVWSPKEYPVYWELVVQ